MRVVFMGTPEFAVTALKALINSDHKVVAVFTRKDAPKNRNMKLVPPPVKLCAEQYGIPVYQPVSIKNEKWLNVLKELDFDIIVVAAYGKILPPSVLSLPKYGCINVHASLLPKYRGASPINAAILNCETETGVSIMKMDEGLDTGDVMLKCSVSIEDTDSFDKLHDKLAEEGGKLLIKALSVIESGNVAY
ncbi:MAG: methionyl-tRNA formyltransferase, partial [Clostridia bacterium]|nr:methionyl-tRNA formyltransferase [Clostridia bacterium]